MKKRLHLIWFLLVAAVSPLTAQSSLLQSGPMVGYSEMREVLLWVQTAAPARVKFSYADVQQPGKSVFTSEVLTDTASAFTAKLPADRVEPGHRYRYQLYINGKAVERPYPLEFQTQHLWQWREDPPPFKMVVGSCAYVNEPVYDRPGKPYGDAYQVFDSIYRQHPDVMLWLGDNTYLREVDWYSRSGILKRYTHTRSLPELQPLLGSVHHYAIWDDHDYGPDNSDRSFRGKEQSLEAFKLFWGNPTFGTNALPGITTMFQWADVDFFLLDNRFYRSPDERFFNERTVLGEAQFQWLIDALSSSRAPFKFIAMGGEFLNPVPWYENYATYPEERARLINAITQENISGVIFLTGDRHHTELSKLPRRDHYPLYDLCVSPLTAGPNPSAADEPNYLRVPGTFVGERNFATLEFSGARKARILKITVYNSDGQELWTQTLAATDLQ